MAESNTPIRLDNFLKFQGIAPTGGFAKLLIQSGEVSVNGEVETRRRRKLIPGDTITVQSELLQPEPITLIVSASVPPPDEHE